MTRIVAQFAPHTLPGDPAEKTALLINPPVYDVHYWPEWSQPYGLLRIGSLLGKLGYRRRELFDFMEMPGREGGQKGAVAKRRIAPGESFIEKSVPDPKPPPYRIEKAGQCLDLWKYHYGKSWAEFDAWLDERAPDWIGGRPDEVWISATMSYWWESARDLVGRLRRRWGHERPLILLGGIYPSIAPEHAARFVQPDLVVQGEVAEANDLWPDLFLYETPPSYAIVTPARGCPFDCAYCAQRTINGNRRQVQYRPVSDILAEMRHAQDAYGIKDFAFYADFLLWDSERNLEPLLESLIADERFYRLYAPEGLDVRLLSQSQRLVDLMKAANFQKLYLPCESINDSYLEQLNRRHVTLEHFVRAVGMCQRAGFDLRHMDVNAFVLYGLPGEHIDDVVKTILFVSEIAGSIIPMLFAPVPSTRIYEQYLPYFRARGWDRDLQMLNGKLYPFLEMNEGSVNDYVDLQRLMYALNAHYRSRSFQLFGDTLVAEAFRDNMRNGFDAFVNSHKTNPPASAVGRCTRP